MIQAPVGLYEASGSAATVPADLPTLHNLVTDGAEDENHPFACSCAGISGQSTDQNCMICAPSTAHPARLTTAPVPAIRAKSGQEPGDTR
jgi:hypothetical protein